MDYEKPHSLGRRAFFLFLFQRIKFSLFLFGLTWLLWHYENRIPDDYYLWKTLAVEFLFLISIGYFALISARTFLEYRRYTYQFTDEGFIVTQGYIVRNETAAVYHQIQAVNIKQTLLARWTGVAELVIFLAGSERESHHNKIILPGVGKTNARIIQKELLARARRHVVPMRQYTDYPTRID